MGYKERDRKALEELKRTRRWAWAKGVFAALTFPMILPFVFGWACWRDNRWPWEIET